MDSKQNENTRASDSINVGSSKQGSHGSGHVDVVNPSGVVTVGDLLKVTLLKFQNFIHNIPALKGHDIDDKISKLSVEETVEWVIWLIGENKSMESAIIDLFSDYGLKISVLSPQELEKIKKFFEIFEKSIKHKF